MKLPRRIFLCLTAGAAVLPAASRIATAQTYPTRPGVEIGTKIDASSIQISRCGTQFGGPLKFDFPGF
jgi:hypothetical protein